jgi:hypothetical protein
MSNEQTPNTNVSANVESSENAVPVSEVKTEEIRQAEVVAQKQKVVGDDSLPEPREPQADVNDEPVAAQVAQPREKESAKVAVHEVVVTTDEVITDPSSPLAVQVPDAGSGSLDLPIHRLAAKRPEDVFAEGDNG